MTAGNRDQRLRYARILDAEFTLGTTYPFFTEFFIPEEAVPATGILAVGDPASDDALYFEPTILDGIP
jgi:hypothetical protein